MDGLFDLDPADTGTLFDSAGLDHGTQLGLSAVGTAHRTVTYQPHSGMICRAEVFCDGPLSNTVWALTPDGTHVVVDTLTFHEVDYTPPAGRP